VPVTLLVPLLGAVLGIDGGPIFQIIAVENLGLSPAAIGTAFGVGVISLPLQLWAARLPLARARRNVQLFLVIVAVQSWILAALVALAVTGPAATTALVVTVTAEVALSVLFATAWQPLLSSRVGATDRQRLNASWSAIARGVLAASLVGFAALPAPARAWFLVIVGVLPLASALSLNTVRPLTTDETKVGQRDAAAPKAKTRPSMSAEMRMVLLVFGALNVGALPLWLVYLDEVLWPTANLGVVGAVQTVASIAALLGWRPTDGSVAKRAQTAAVVTALGSAGLLLVNGPAERIGAQAILLAVTAMMAAGSTTVRIAMLESAHRIVSTATSVRSFTLLDVVASTSLQVGLFISGWLITVSAPGGMDAYRAFVIGATVIAVATVRMVTTRQ
jgi:hypothetical protein